MADEHGIMTKRALIGGWAVEEHPDNGLILTAPGGRRVVVVPGSGGSVAFMDMTESDEQPWAFQLVLHEGTTAGARIRHGSPAVLQRMEPGHSQFACPLPQGEGED